MDFSQKILLVDDHPENLYSLESVLAEPGREFYNAGSGQEALRLAYLHDFALILLDVQMPEMDGFEVAEILRSSKRTRDVAILFVTAINTDRKYVLKGLQQGAIDYLQKPLDTDILRAKVQTLLRIHQQQVILEQKNRELKQLNEEKNYFLSIPIATIAPTG